MKVYSAIDKNDGNQAVFIVIGDRMAVCDPVSNIDWDYVGKDIFNIGLIFEDLCVENMISPVLIWGV